MWWKNKTVCIDGILTSAFLIYLKGKEVCTQVNCALSCSTFAIVIKLLSLLPFVMVLLMFIFKQNSVKYFLFLVFVLPFKTYPEVRFVAMWYNAYSKLSFSCVWNPTPQKEKMFCIIVCRWWFCANTLRSSPGRQSYHCCCDARMLCLNVCKGGVM